MNIGETVKQYENTAMQYDKEGAIMYLCGVISVLLMRTQEVEE